MLIAGARVIVIRGEHAGKRGTIGEVASPFYDGESDVVWIDAKIQPVAHNDLIVDFDPA
jgi:hypothetical protein